jgi:putative heme-binding domain-containing protein
VTRRLTRAELAEALVYPSKQVADRFKAFSLEARDGTILTGFITEQTDTAVTFADQQQVRQIPRVDIIRLAPQASSLMPDRLLNRLTEEETRDLLAYLDSMGASP